MPLSRSLSRIALIGPLGDDAGDLLGCWPGMGRSEDVVTLRRGLAAALPGAQIQTVRGCDLTGGTDAGIAEAVALARQADVVILAVGEPALWSGEKNFRSSLGLPGLQDELVRRVAAVGKPVVTVLFAGRPLAVPELLEKSGAVLLAWHPGIQGGPALADLLTGAAAPSGRITASFPRSVGQVPVYYNHQATGRPMRDYRDGPRDPLLPFGFGLTYTHFTYSGTQVRRGAGAANTVTAVATVANDGPVAGTEVAQLYIRELACSFGARPIRELRGFRRLSLAAGESRHDRVHAVGRRPRGLDARGPVGGAARGLRAGDRAGRRQRDAGAVSLGVSRQAYRTSAEKPAALRAAITSLALKVPVICTLSASFAASVPVTPLTLLTALLKSLTHILQQRCTPVTFSPCTSPSFAPAVARWIAGSLGIP